MKRLRCVSLAGWVLFFSITQVGVAQDSEQPNEKAERYHEALKNRPNPGYLFDRFFDAWLDSGTVEGLETYLKSAAENPNAATADRLLLAFFHSKQGDDLAALEVFDEALKDAADNPDAWFQKARIEARLLNFEAAIGDLDRAAAAGPKSELATEIGKLRGQLLIRNGQKDEALAAWGELLAASPEDEDLHEDLIELQLDEGLFEEAAATSNALIERTTDPYNKVLRQLRLGDIQERSGDRAAALESYAGTLSQTGSGTWIEREVLASIEKLFRREDDLDGFLDFIAGQAGKDEQRLALRRRRAELLAEQGFEDESIEAWKKILELTPGDRAIREAFVQTLAMLQRQDEAVAQMKALIALYPDDAELLVLLAAFQAQAKDSDGAGASLAAYLEKAGQTEYAFLRTARLLQTYKRTEQAGEVFQQLLDAFPDSIDAKEAYAAFLYETEKRDEALEIWKNLAESGDALQAVRIAQSLGARRENELAFEVLKSRYEELGANPVYLSQLCEAAIRVEKAGEAFPWARRRVVLARDALDLTDAVKLAARVTRRAEDGAARIEELRAADSLSVREVCLLAELLEQDGWPDQADSALAEIEGEEITLALAQQARLYRERQHWDAAAETQLKLVQTPGGRNSAQVQALVDLYVRGLEFEEAARWIEEWKKLSPGSISPWLKQANLESSEGRHEDAVHTLRSAAQRFDDNADIRAQLAEAYHALGKLADAERLFWRLYEDEEDSAGKINWVKRLASIAQEMGRLDRLIEQFEERRRGARTSILPLLALAEIYRIANRDEERRQAILTAARIKPDDVGLLHQLASMDEAAGQIAAAIRSLETALERDQTDRTRSRLTRLHFLNGDFERGFATMRGQDGASDPEQLLEAAQHLIRNGAWEQAADFLARFLGEHPEDFRLFYLRAVTLEESEQTDLAFDAFQQVLRFEKELPKQSNTPAPNAPVGIGVAQIFPGAASPQQQQQLQEKLEQRFPKGVMQISRMVGSMAQAYQYRQGQGAGRIYGFHNRHGHGMSAQIIAIPQDPETTRAWAIAHLLKIAGEDEDRGKIVDEAFDSLGFPSRLNKLLEMQQAVMTSQNQQSRQEMIDYFLANPDDELLHGLWLNWLSNFAPDARIAKNAFNLFKEKRPVLAFSAASNLRLFYAMEGPEGIKPLVGEALELLPEIEDELLPNDLLSLLFLIFGDMELRTEGGGEGILTDAQRDAIFEITDRNEERMMNFFAPGFRNELRQGLLIIQMMRGELESYVSYLEKQVSKHQQNKAAIRAAAAGTRSQLMNQVNFDGALAFPPMWMPAVPTEIRINFANLPWHYVDENYLPKKDQLAPLVEKVEDRQLRLLMAHYCGQKEAVEKIVTEIAAAEPPTAEALLLAATFAAQNEDTSAAAELLGKARFLRTDPATAWLIDAGLVSLALKADEGATVREAGRGAALRLQASQSFPRQGSEAAEILAQLGLKREAMRTGPFAGNRPSRPSSTSAMAGSLTNPQGIATRIVQLLENGQEEAAIRIGANQLKSMATTVLGDEGRHLEYQFRQMREKIVEYGALKAILDEARPDDDAELLERVQFAALADVLGDQKAATAMYEAILKDRPDDDAIRKRLAFQLAGVDNERALAHLKKLEASGEELSRIADSMFTDPWHQLQTLDEKFELAELAIEYLEGLESLPANGNDYWIRNLMGYVSNSQSADGIRLNDLYQSHGGYDRSRYDKDQLAKIEAAEKRRREIHDRLAEVMIEIPSQSAIGFSYVSALRIYEEGEEADEELIELAKRVLREMPEPVFIGNNYTLTPNGSSWSGSGLPNSNEVQRVGPIEFLVQRLGRAGDEKGMQALLAELEEDESKAKISSVLKSWSGLYFCEPDDFLEAAKNADTGVDYGMAPVHFLAVVDAWKFRELEVDLLEITKGLVQSDSGDEVSWAVVLPAMAAADRGDTETVNRALEMAAERFLGPKADRAAFVAEHFKPNSGYSHDSPNGRAHQMVELLNSLGEHPALRFPAFKMLAETGLHRSERYYQLIQPFYNNGFWTNPEAGLAQLKNSPFTAAAFADFDPIPVEKTGYLARQKENTLAGMMAKRMSESNESARTAFREWALTLPENAFGARLLAALLAEEDRDRAVLVELAKFDAAIRGLDEDQQLPIALFASDLVDPGKIPSDLDPQAEALWKHLYDLGGGNIDGYEQLLKAETLNDLGIRAYQFDDHVSGLIVTRLANDKTDEAFAALKQALKIEDESRKQNQWSSGLSEGETFAGEVFDQTFRAGDAADVHWFLTEVVYSGDFPPIEIQADYGEARDLGNLITENASTSAALKAGFAILAKRFENREVVPMSGWVFDYLLDRIPESEVSAMIEWAESEEATAQHSGLAADLAAVGRIRRDYDAAGNKKIPMPAESAAHVVERLRDAAVPLPIRIKIAEKWCGGSLAECPPEVVLAAADCVAESWTKHSPVYYSDLRKILSEFGGQTPDETWGAAAERLTGAFHERYFSGSAPERLSKDPYDDTIVRMIAINLIHGDVAGANQLLTKFESRLSNFTSPFLHLVNAGELASATRLLRKHFDDITLASYPGSIRWTEEFAENARQLLDAIESPQQKLLAEVVLAAVREPGETGRDAEPGTPRSSRVEAAARNLVDSEISSNSARLKALELLSYHRGSREIIGDLLVEQTAGMNLGPMFDNWNDGSRRNVRLFEAAALHLNEQGEIERYLEYAEKLRSVKTRNGSTRDDALGRVVRAPFAALKASQGAAEEAKRQLPALRKLAMFEENNYGPKQPEFLGWIAFATHQAGAWDKVDPWLESLGEETGKELFEKFRHRENFLATMRSAQKAIGEAPVEERVDWVQAYLSEEWVAKNVRAMATAFNAMIYSKFMTREEVLQHGEAMAEAVPRRGQAWPDLAMRIEQIEKDFERSLKIWERGLESSKPEQRYLWIRLHLGKSNALLKLGRKAEARAVFEKIDLDDIPEGMRKLSQELAKEFDSV